MTANTVLTQGTILEVESASAGVYVEVGEFLGWQGPGAPSKEIDITNLRSTAREFRLGLYDGGSFSVDFNRYFSDTGQQRMRALWVARTTSNFKVTFPSGTVLSFAGYVMEFSYSGAPDDVVKGKATIRISGAITEA